MAPPDKTHPFGGEEVQIDVVSAAEHDETPRGDGRGSKSGSALNVAKPKETPFWRFRWTAKVKPRYLVALVPLLGALVMAGGWVAINSVSRTACGSQENDALLQFWNAANGIQEEVVTHTYAATTIASYVRQQPNLQEILAYPFQDIATDLLELDSSVINLQIAPGGRVNTIVPLAGNEGAIGHDLFLDPKRRADALRTVENGGLTLAGPFDLLQGGKGLLARNPVFLPAPTGNRTEAWGFPDAHECGDLCYGDEERIFWGFAVALIDWERLLANTPLGDIVLGSNKYELTRSAGSAAVTILNSDEVPVGAGQRVVNIPIPLPSTTWMLAVQLSNSCESWVPGAVAAWAAGSLLLTLAGFYALHLMAQNSDLQRKELEQLREAAEQREREKVLAGSEAVGRMVAGVVKVSQKEFKRLGRALARKSSLEGQSMSLAEPLGLSSDINGFRVSILVPNFDLITATSKSAATEMFTMTKGLCWNLAAESGGHDMEEANGALSARFKHASAAVAFALKARRTLMWASWPEEALVLPGCSQMSEGFRMAGGPRVSMLIDTSFSSELATVTKRYVSCIHPRQILITGSAWAKVTNMQDAGYPYVLPLGKFAASEGLDTGVEDVVTLLEVNEPVWDYRLPQLRFGQLKNITKVMDCSLNLHVWPRMTGSSTSQPGEAESPKMITALLQLDTTGSNGTPGQQMLTELNDAVQSVALLFHGFMCPVPLSWAQGSESAVFFPSVDCAFAFCASLQMLMSNKQWGAGVASQFPFPYAGQITGPLARDGPRLKSVIVSAREAIVGLFKNLNRNAGGDQSLRGRSRPPWLGFELLRVAHGGQVIADSGLLAELTLAVPSLMDIIDLGVHQVANGFGNVRICEARLLELGPPTFPKLHTSKELVPGYLAAPCATTDLAFVYCQISALGSSATASSSAFMGAIELWKDWCRNNLRAYGGYDCGDRSTAMVLTFPSLEGAVSFCLTMQREAMDLPVSEELLKAKGYEPVVGKSGQVIFRGIKPKAGIAFGTPIMCRPHQKTGLANYFGPCVTKAVKLMVAAAPGQVLADGPAMATSLHLPEEWRQDEWSIELSDEGMAEAGCSQIHLKTLGRYKLEGEAVPVRIMSLSLPELAERTFSALPGKISEDGKVCQSPCGSAGGSSNGGSRTQPSANLNSMISDLLENKTALSSGNNAKVQVLGVLGQGTQGKVLLGRWKGVKVAYKITQIPMGGSGTKTQRAEMHALMELAISTAMGHPNVVQTYNYELVKVDMKEGQEQAEEENSAASALMKASQVNTGVMPDSCYAVDHDPLDAVGNNSQDAPTMYEARLIQELCVGSLRTYLDKKKLNSPGSSIPNTLMALTLATDIANGLSHVHSLGIIHGDLKALNVLLARSMRRPLHTDSSIPSMEAKISDFGLSKRLDSEATHVSNTFSGTLTHMAPEVILAGKLSKSADVYAYGIMLYEIFTGRRAFEGLNSHQVSQEVTSKNRRPVFDEGVPRQVVTLACECWGPAQKRPTMDQVLESLMSLQKSLKQEAMMQAPTPRSSASRGSITSVTSASGDSTDPSRSADNDSGVDFAALQRRGSLQARAVSFSTAVAPGRISEPNRPMGASTLGPDRAKRAPAPKASSDLKRRATTTTKELQAIAMSNRAKEAAKGGRASAGAALNTTSAQELPAVVIDRANNEAKGGRASAGAAAPSIPPVDPDLNLRSMLINMSSDDDDGDDDDSESGSDHGDPALPVAEV